MTDLKVLQSTAVNNTHFNQSIGWNKVTSDNQNISHYIIKYGLSSDVNSYDSEGVSSTTSTTNSTTLTLPLPTSPTTYNVWVVAVSYSTGTGKYSEVLKINYTGNVFSIHAYTVFVRIEARGIYFLPESVDPASIRAWLLFEPGIY